ncbi:calcium and integrin-binding family member 2-like [Rhopilema esculentum]|uniref:calcium and integrin-binding family member 2-like n=1 Tax=Rhopilema esculentum TaxID=499914 RepID=UPI0031DB93DF
MGNSQTHFSDEKLEYYHKECTFFSKNDILRIYRKFKSLDDSVPDKYSKAYRIPKEKLWKMKELEENPFRDRIYHVFSTDQVDSLNFDEFLDMHSVFNSQAPSGIKIAYLFKIYDMDNDSKLGRNDLLAVLDRITDSSLETSERNEIIDKIFEESNWNGDDVLDFYEFEQVLAKAPYFLSTLNLRF